MGETMECIWCEDGEGGVDDEELHDPDYDKEADYANWVRYGPCNNCGAFWTSGTKFISFSEINEKGDPRKSVEQGCHNCRWEIENPEFDALGCPVCVHGEYIGAENPDARDNWEIRKDWDTEP